MLVAAAVCPAPPLLVPEVAVGAAPELEGVRAACLRALGALGSSAADRLYVVGTSAETDRTGRFAEGATGSLREFGVDRELLLGRRAAQPVDAGLSPQPALPPSLTVGAWLLEEYGWDGVPVEGLAVPQGLSGEECEELGAGLAAEAERTALLVLGDGSACRTLKAPGYLDPRAEGFDAGVAAALGAADVDALAGIDRELAAELQVAGRAAWQVLAGAARVEGAGAALSDGGRGGLHAELLADEAPYGVGYFVALWTR